jgi:hypothetical protein
MPTRPIETPFVSVPGLLTAQCVANEKGSYLEVTVHGDPADRRTDDITGDVISNGEVNPSWGLHLIDVNLAQGNLVDIVREQGKAYRGGKPFDPEGFAPADPPRLRSRPSTLLRTP